jgi:hypothetical protein
MPGHRHRAPLVKRSIIPIVFRGNALNDWNDCTIQSRKRFQTCQENIKKGEGEM